MASDAKEKDIQVTEYIEKLKRAIELMKDNLSIDDSEEETEASSF